MTEALAEITPIAIAIAISPIPIVAVILMLLSERGVANAAGFLVGWIVALLLVAGVAAALGLSIAHTDDDPSLGATVARLVLAAVLLLVAARRWRGRPRHGEEVTPPAWLNTVSNIDTGKATALGFGLIALNPKDGLLSLFAGSRLSDATLTTPQALVALVVFAVIASATIALPLFAVVARGHRADPTLARARGALQRHGSVATAVIALVFGLLIGINALLALG